jgi:hypothetical protein
VQKSASQDRKTCILNGPASKREPVSNAKKFSCERMWDRSVYGEAIEVIEPTKVGPRRQTFFPESHERFLKAGHRLDPAFRITGRNHTSLAGIVAKKRYAADSKGLELVRFTEKAVFPKRFTGCKFEIGPEPTTRAFERQFRKPANDFLKTSRAGNRRPVCNPVIRKTFVRLENQSRRKPEKRAEPSIDFLRFAQNEVLFLSIALNPKTSLSKVVRKDCAN